MNNTTYNRARTDRLIKERFVASFMSDTKWIKLLKALAEIGDSINSCKAKLVWDDALRDFRIDPNLTYGFDFYQHSMEAMVSGQPKGFYEYKELELIEFPHEGQNVEKIREHINSIGQFELELTANWLRLYAYK